MRISEQLEDAIKVSIHVGQLVVVRTPGGEVVTSGYVEDVDPKRGLVRVRSNEDGTDVNFDVDTSLYKLWVTPPEFGAPQGSDPPNLFVRSNKPGPYGRQWAHSTAGQ